MTREERLRAEDMGDYFRVSADTRDLNYDKFVVDGEVQHPGRRGVHLPQHHPAGRGGHRGEDHDRRLRAGGALRAGSARGAAVRVLVTGARGFVGSNLCGR